MRVVLYDFQTITLLELSFRLLVIPSVQRDQPTVVMTPAMNRVNLQRLFRFC